MTKKPLFVLISVLIFILVSSLSIANNLSYDSSISTTTTYKLGVSNSNYTDAVATNYYTGSAFCRVRIRNIDTGSIQESFPLGNIGSSCSLNFIAYDDDRERYVMIGDIDNVGYIYNRSFGLIDTLSSSRFSSVEDVTYYNNNYYTVKSDRIQRHNLSLNFIDEKLLSETGIGIGDMDSIAYDHENSGFVVRNGFNIYILDNQLNYVNISYTLIGLGGSPDLRGMEVNEDFIMIRDFTSGNVYKWTKYDDIDIPVTAGGITYNTSGLCMDVNGDSIKELCTDANVQLDFYGNPSFTCNSLLETQACNLGCNNVENNGLVSGVCSNTVPNQECGFLGLQKCQTITSYATCQDTNQDGVLTYENLLNCPVNQYCIDTELGAQCVGLNITQSEWSQQFVNVNLDINETNAYEQNEQTISKVSSSLGLFNPLTTPFNPFTQFFFRTVAQELTTKIKIDKVNEQGVGVEYSAFSCDFEKEILEQDLNDYLINSTQNAVVSLARGSNNQEVEIVFENIGSGNHTLTYQEDGLNIAQARLEYDASSKKLIIREHNNRVIYNVTSIQPSDTLQRVYIKTVLNKEIGQYTHEIQAIRQPINEFVIERKYGLPTSYINTGLGVANNLVVNSTGNITLVEVTNTKTGKYPAYEQNQITEDDFVLCGYIDVGCRNVIVWANEDINGFVPPTYHFYEQIESCVSQVGSQTSGSLVTQNIANDGQPDFLENIFGRQFTDGEKLIIGVVISAIVFFGIVLGFRNPDGEVESGQIIIASLLSGLTIFMFTVFGYIPEYIIIVLGIISIAIGVYASRRFFFT